LSSDSRNSKSSQTTSLANSKIAPGELAVQNNQEVNNSNNINEMVEGHGHLHGTVAKLTIKSQN
jgi:hypothetical protein